jgi:hypothetical protein
VYQSERSVTMSAFIELAGYVGAAAALVATLFAVERANGLGDVGGLLVALAITAVLVGVGLAIPQDSPDAFRRMHSVLWFAAAIAWGITVDQFLSSVVELDPQGDVRGILIGIVTTAGAAILWVGLRRSLQLIALFGTTVGTLSALIELTAEGFEPADPTATAVVFWVFGVAWGIASDREMLRPLRTGMVLGTLTAVISPYGIAVPTGFEIPSEATITIAAVWSFATSAVASAFGTIRGERAVQGIAIVGVIVGTGVIVGNNFTDSDPATIVTLVVGLALLGAALIAIRSARASSRPADVVPPSAPPPPPPPSTA